jgi:hypothetical protein
VGSQVRCVRHDEEIDRVPHRGHLRRTRQISFRTRGPTHS